MRPNPGNDIFVGQVGENDYDAEGGDDLMAQNAAVDRNAGAGGFDWAFHQYDTVGADDDMMINNNLARSRCRSSSTVTAGRRRRPTPGRRSTTSSAASTTHRADVGGAGFTGCDALDQAGIDRITGLSAIAARPADRDLAPAWPLRRRHLPARGPIWAEGDILLGGGGSDTSGPWRRRHHRRRPGAQRQHQRPHEPANPATEIGSADLMEGQYKRDGTGSLTGPTLQAGSDLQRGGRRGQPRRLREQVTAPSP